MTVIPSTMSIYDKVTIYTLFTLLFLAIGSLLNVVIYRLPIMLQMEWLKECSTLLKQPNLNSSATPINLFWPRSFCPNCQKTLKLQHNLPLLSFFLLNKRCGHCHHPISWQYPIVEAVTCLLSLGIVAWFGPNLTCVFSLMFLWLLIPLTVIDYQHQLLPDSLSLSLLWLGLVANIQQLFTTLPNAIMSTIIAYLGLWIFIKLFYLVTGKVGMGNGDFKLFAAFGAWFGWTQLPLILLLASLLGSIYGIVYLKWSKQTTDTPIPFGPFLSLAGLIALFFGKTIIRIYTQSFLF